ncbi:caspase-8 isoform X2 [Agrilus planipennis]|nr:caspase-8 isoform X2 [Agrilus planipennis]
MGTSFSTIFSDTCSDTEVVYRDEDVSDSELMESEDELTMDNINCTIDAINSASSGNYPIHTKHITLENLPFIEKHLDFDEKVSLVFLLYDNIQVALQTLLLLKHGSESDVITEWAKSSQSNPYWHDKLLEALAIIQNLAIIRKLDMMEDIESRFLPRNMYGHLFVDPIKKLLYLLCEHFDSKTTKNFVSYLQNKYKDCNIHYSSENLEITLLSLLSTKCISLDDMSSFAQILKELGIEAFYDQLKKFCKSNGCEEIKPLKNGTKKKYALETCQSQKRMSDKVSNFCVDQNVGVMELGGSDFSRRSSVSASSENDCNSRNRKISNSDLSYKINEYRPGVCLIIDQENFYTECDQNLKDLLLHDEKLEDRVGTEKDKVLLKETFKAFGFTVYIEKNKTHAEIITVIEQVVMKITDESSLFVCVLSHGTEGKVYGVNSIPVDVNKIKNSMCRKNLKNLREKPKILILQACQGSKCQEVINVDINEEIDSLEMDSPVEAIAYADMFVFTATIPGFGAVRDKKNGTWFIQSFCQNLKNHWHEYHFEDICTLVQQDVISKRWGSKVMVPEKKGTLSKFFYLPEYHAE